MKVSLVQMNSQDDKSANLKSARTLIEKAVAEEQPDLVVLPEYYAFLGNTPEEMHDSAETFPNGESYRLAQSKRRSRRSQQDTFLSEPASN